MAFPLIPVILGGLGLLAVAWVTSSSSSNSSNKRGPRQKNGLEYGRRMSPEVLDPVRDPVVSMNPEVLEPVVIVRHGGGGAGSQGKRRAGDLKGAAIHFATGTKGGDLENVLFELRKATNEGNPVDYNVLVTRSGKVIEILPPNVIAPHAHVAEGKGHSVGGSNNRHTLGVAFLNSSWSSKPKAGWMKGPLPPAKVVERARSKGVEFGDHVWWQPYPVPQLEGAARYLAKVFHQFGVTNPEIWGHGQLNKTKADPGPAFPAKRFAARVRELQQARALSA